MLNAFFAAILCTGIFSASSVAGQGAFVWGRPCGLKGSGASNANEVLPSCTPCGSGTSATPEPSCTYTSSSIPVGTTVDYSYYASAHNLFIGSSPCAYTTEICPNKPANQVTTASPCSYTFKTPGTFYLSDKASNAAGDYCTAFGANKKYVVS